MAEESDAATRTEEPTPRKLDEARKRGEVAKSLDVPAFASLAAVAGFIALGGGYLARNLAEQLQPFIAHADAYDLAGGGGGRLLSQAGMAAAPIVLGVMLVASLAGIAGNLIQHGLLFTTERLKPDLSRLSPAAGFRRLFGVDGLVHFLKQAVKVVFLGAVAYLCIRPRVGALEGAVAVDPMGALLLAADALRGLFLGALAVLGAGAALDWLWQRQRFWMRMRMTREELREDNRQTDGDPQVAARLRRIRNDRRRPAMAPSLARASVVVADAARSAVALRYDQGDTPTPVCLAKGLDHAAVRMRAIAAAHRVPVIEDGPLARALYAGVEVGAAIPRQHYEAVAKVIGVALRWA